MSFYIANVYANLIKNPKTGKTIDDVPKHLKEEVLKLIGENNLETSKDN